MLSALCVFVERETIKTVLSGLRKEISGEKGKGKLLGGSKEEEVVDAQQKHPILYMRLSSFCVFVRLSIRLRPLYEMDFF